MATVASSDDVPLIQFREFEECKTVTLYPQVPVHTITVCITDCGTKVSYMHVNSDWCPIHLFQQLGLAEQPMAIISVGGTTSVGDEFMPFNNTAFHMHGVVTIALPTLSLMASEQRALQARCQSTSWPKFAGAAWCQTSSDAVNLFSDIPFVAEAQARFLRLKKGKCQGYGGVFVNDLIFGRDLFFHRQDLDELVETFEEKVRRCLRLSPRFPPFMMSLRSGRQLVRGRSLWECKVDDGSTVQVMLSMFGGMPKRPREAW